MFVLSRFLGNFVYCGVVSFKFKLFQLNWIQFLVAVFSYGFHVIFAIVFTVC